MKKQTLGKLGIVLALGAMIFLGMAAHYADAAIHARLAPFPPGAQEVIQAGHQCPLCQFLSHAHLSNQLGQVAQICALLKTWHQVRPAQNHPEQLYSRTVFSRGPPMAS